MTDRIASLRAQCGGPRDGALLRVMMANALLAESDAVSAIAELRRALLARLGAAGGALDYHAAVDSALDAIAAELERHVAIDALIAVARQAAGA